MFEYYRSYKISGKKALREIRKKFKKIAILIANLSCSFSSFSKIEFSSLGIEEYTL